MRRRKAHGRVTLADVAQRAGVSTASVSRALNLSSSVADGIRKKVAGAVVELGYRPNAAARALAANRSHMVGIIVPTIANSIFAPGVQAIEETLEAADYGLIIATSGYDPSREFEQAKRLIARGIDGLILVGLHRAPGMLDLIEKAGVPTVVQGAFEANGALPCIGFDNHAAMKLMAEHVIELGHRRIAVLAGISTDNDRVQARIAATQQACAQAGLTAPAIVEAPYDISAARVEAGKLLHARSPPTAIVCINDILAIGAVLAARDHGISVPQDLTVTRFDDFDIAASFDPPITTVRVPVVRMGQAVASSLLRNLVEGERISEQQLSIEFVRRGSCAAPSVPEDTASADEPPLCPSQRNDLP